jgi:DNA mismatch repair protein MutS2
MNEIYLEKIEFPKIREILSTYCKTYIGKVAALNLMPYNSEKEITKALKQTTEAVILIYRKGNSPISEIENISLHLKRLENESPLSAKQLLDLAQILKIAKELKHYFEADDNIDLTVFPYLANLFYNLYTNDDVQNKVLSSIIDENTISDDASLKLASIRRDKRNKEQEIRNKLNSFLRTKYVQEPVITMRAGRFVVPIKNEFRSEVKGFVHDISSSGSTVFIEPISVFDLNNEINNLNLEENLEIERILEKLSSLFFTLTEQIKNNSNLIGLLDFIFAKAKYSKDLDASEPSINNEKYINLLQAWHPLISKDIAVKNDISLGKNYTNLIITGPNTGGKTVTLKTVGLLSLMAMCGMHIPAKEGSSICIFDNIFADIGDEQSIADSLSTFSSHMKYIANILQEATSESLVLLDELGSGTDPVEGASLAISILENLNIRGCLTLATTHYPELKHFALVTEGFENASAEFNIDTLSPTYKLLIGVPGASNAFEISKKLGLPESVISRAKEFLSNDEINIEELLKNIYENKQTIEKEKAEILEKSEEIEKLRKQLKSGNTNLKDQEKEIIEKAKNEARQILLDAKEEASEAIREIEKGGNSKQLNSVRNNLNTKIGNLQTKSTASKVSNSLDEKQIKIGMPVFIPSINQTGNIISMPTKEKTVQVQVGIMKMNFKISDLEPTEKNEQKQKNYSYSKEHSIDIKSVSSEINVIGQNVEEACFSIDKYLDTCTINGLHTVRIVHGKGTGALRKGIHQFLKNHPHVQSYRMGTFGEGEMGVTVVELK